MRRKRSIGSCDLCRKKSHGKFPCKPSVFKKKQDLFSSVVEPPVLKKCSSNWVHRFIFPKVFQDRAEKKNNIWNHHLENLFVGVEWSGLGSALANLETRWLSSLTLKSLTRVCVILQRLHGPPWLQVLAIGSANKQSPLVGGWTNTFDKY